MAAAAAAAAAPAAAAAAGPGISAGAAAAQSPRAWFCLDSTCVHCGGDDFTGDYGPRHFILCSCCSAAGTHVDCYEASSGKRLTQEFIASGSSWFCCKVRC